MEKENLVPEQESDVPEQESEIPEPEKGPQEGEAPASENGSGQPGWFKDFVDHYDVDKPQQGEMLTGKILDIQEGSILLDVGLKRDAIIPGQDLDRVDPEIRDKLAVGDEITVGVIRTPLGDDDLLVSLQKGLTQQTWVEAEKLLKEEKLVELEVVEQNRGGLLVAYDNLRGFVPNSLIPAIRRGTSTQKAGEIKADLIGKKLAVKAVEVNPKEHRLVFSARSAQKDQRHKRLEELEIGQVIQSRVVNVVDFGVFVDLNGVDGLVHKSELEWDRVPHPSKLYKVNDEIEVKVVAIDMDKERVSLSRKALLPNPWEKLAEKVQVGDLIEGVVVSVVDFGAFVEIRPGLQGLVHISEIGYANPEDPKAVVKKGDPVLVKVMGIEPERERISLSMRRVPLADQMEWIMNIEDLADAAKLDGAALSAEEEGTPDEEGLAVEELDQPGEADQDSSPADAAEAETLPDPAAAEDPEKIPVDDQQDQASDPDEGKDREVLPEEDPADGEPEGEASDPARQGE